MLSYSAVICAYTLDRWDDLLVCVRSVQAQAPRPREVIVVIDHNEELLGRAGSYFTACTVIANEQQRGLSGARNTGVAKASGDVVAFIDDDARCDPGWAAHLLAPYADAHVVGVGGRVLPDWRAPRPAWLPDEFLWTVGCSYRGQPAGEARVRNAIGANMSFRRSALEKVGGFNVLVGRVGADAAGCEETELSIRATRSIRGGHIVLSPNATVHHAVTSGRVSRKYFIDRCRAEGRSKAIVSTLVGEQDALSSERAYVTRTLPIALLQSLIPRRLHGRGAGQGIAVLEGFTVTVAAYLVQRLRQRRGRRPIMSASLAPERVAKVR